MSTAWNSSCALLTGIASPSLRRLGRVEEVPVGNIVPACFGAPRLRRQHEAVDHAGLGGELAQRLAHLREGEDAVRLGDPPRDADEEAQLHRQADLALVVLVDV